MTLPEIEPGMRPSIQSRVASQYVTKDSLWISLKPSIWRLWVKEAT